jgi:transglutaminase-like putative cysteine protease
LSKLAETSGAAIEPYVDGKAGAPKPGLRLWRTWLHRPRPLRQFAARIAFDPARDQPDPEIAAHWGEHIVIEDFVTVLHRDGTISGLRHVVTQLHSAEALSQWDEVQRFFDTRKELHRFLQARIWLPDGTVRQAVRKQFVVPAPDSRPNNRGRTLQLWFAPLRPGVVLEFEEQYDQFRPDELGPYMWNHFFLTTRAPAVRRRFTAAVAEPFQLSYRVHHADIPPSERKHKKYRVYTWDLHNVDGVECDEWTPPIRDFVPWLDVSTAPSWAPFAVKLFKELEPELAPADVRELAIELASGKSSALEKSVAAYQYAAQNVRYGRPPAEALARNIRASTQMFEDLRGDCKDKSALLVQLLRSMELPAQVAVVLTADSGRAPFLPSTRFNHAVVKLSLPDQVVWLDPASGPFAFGDLPPIDQDIVALVFHRHGYSFDRIPVPGSSAPSERREIAGQLALDGSYAVKANIRIRGETAARLRLLLTDRTADHRREVLQMWFGNDYGGAIGSDYEHTALNDLSDGLAYTCQARLERVARRLKNVLLLQVPWANPLTMSGPMSAAVRRQPLALPPVHRVFEQHTIELPEGVTVFAAPEPVSLKCPWGTYKCVMKTVEGRLVCQRLLHLQGRIVPSASFPEFREFWRQASWSDTAQVVLRIG